jgi:sulfofructose kinase
MTHRDARPCVAGVGHVALDLVFEVDTIPQQPVKVAARALRRVVGGMTASACVAAARLGAEVRFGSPVGDDDAAAHFAQHFAHEGVDPCGLQRVAGAQSSVSAVLVDAQGQRLVVSHHGQALRAPPPLDEAWLTQADVVIADPRCPDWAAAALRSARRRGVPGVLDGDVAPRADLQRLAGLAAWAVCSEPGVAALLGLPFDGALDASTVQRGLTEVLVLGAGVAVVTLGEHGLWWQRRGEPPAHLAAYDPGPVVDTLGAGDAFHGALAVALAEGQDDLAALRFASMAAALKCTRPGGIAGAPVRAEVDAHLAARA